MDKFVKRPTLQYHLKLDKEKLYHLTIKTIHKVPYISCNEMTRIKAFVSLPNNPNVVGTKQLNALEKAKLLLSHINISLDIVHRSTYHKWWSDLAKQMFFHPPY